MKKGAILAVLTLVFSLFQAKAVYAQEGAVLGIHIMNLNEAPQARELLKGNGLPDEWRYVTIPVTLNDLHKQKEWQDFFDYAKAQKLIPIVRLTTKPDGSVWAIPSQKDVTDLITFLSSLNWPTDQKYIIVFNEVNHAKEWGNSIDPAGYADILSFTSNWAKSENKNYQILPAAMDLAAPNGKETQEAFTYLEKMREHDPNILTYVDFWNSHSYPNPGFSSAPTRSGKQSLRGYQTELSYVKEKTGNDLKTFITETGWVDTNINSRLMSKYYMYAAQNIWNDDRIMAVTPFILQGAPGPFAPFTFLDANGKPTYQYRAYQEAMKSLASSTNIN